MRDIVFTRASGWIPNVVREDGELKLMLGAGADANHEPRTFTFSIGEAHLAVIQEDLARHLLLWSAVLPLCDAAGTRGRLDEHAAAALLDPILLSPPADVDAFFRRIRWDRARLIAHGADIGLLERGQLCAAMRAATETSNAKRAQKYHADRRRAERGTVLGPLDAALLMYTGQYLHGATVPKRLPDAVDPALLPEVIRVITTAEQACAGMRIGLDPRKGKRATDKRDWDRMTAAVDTAVRRARPELADDAVRTVSFLMCSEAATRARNTPLEDDEEAAGDRPDSGGGARKTILSFTDDKGGEKKWLADGPRSATAEFWEFVADRSAADNEVFTIEDEEMGEGIQLHFYADSIARITTVREAEGGSDPEYRVEYGLVDGLGAYRSLVTAFVRGGCAALDQHGPWIPDAAEFERARKRRDTGQGEPAPVLPEDPAKERTQESVHSPTQAADSAAPLDRDLVGRFCRFWADTGYNDPTDSYYVLFDSRTLDETGEDRDELLRLVQSLGLETVDAPPGAADGEVWVRVDPRIDAELGNWA